MAFRIDLAGSSRAPVLQLSGDLTGPYVAVLLDQCRIHGARASISLASLVSADEAGLAAIRLLKAFGMGIVGASPYFQMLLTERAVPSDAVPDATIASWRPRYLATDDAK